MPTPPRTPPSPSPDFELRVAGPGDLGWIIQRHGELYHEMFDWGEGFEALVAGIVLDFMRDRDPERERAWLAWRDGQRIGSVCLVENAPGVAQLRLLIVDPAARGMGVGGALVRRCTDFAREKGYGKVVLWTDARLDAARRLYRAEGYRMVREEPHEGFGTELHGQYWELELGPPD